MTTDCPARGSPADDGGPAWTVVQWPGHLTAEIWASAPPQRTPNSTERPRRTDCTVWQLPLRVGLGLQSESSLSPRTLEALAGAEAGLPLGVRGSPTQSDSGLLPVLQRPAARRRGGRWPGAGPGPQATSEPGLGVRQSVTRLRASE